MIPTDASKSDLERFGLTTCEQCGELIHQDEMLVKVYYTADGQRTVYFCSQKCKEEWYVQRLQT